MKTLINIKTDRDVKEKAQKLAKELGLPLSTIINASLKQFIRSRELCFSVAPRMTSSLEDIIKEAERDYNDGKNISGPFTTARETDKYLNTL